MTENTKFQGATPHMRKGTAKVLQVTIISLLLIVGLVLSMAFPFGVGVMLFLGLLVVAGALMAVGISCVKLFKAILAPSVTFGYNPSASYLSGKKASGKKTEDKNEESETKESS